MPAGRAGNANPVRAQVVEGIIDPVDLSFADRQRAAGSIGAGRGGWCPRCGAGLERMLTGLDGSIDTAELSQARSGELARQGAWAREQLSWIG